MNRLRRFYEKVPFGQTSSRVAYATNVAALPEFGCCFSTAATADLRRCLATWALAAARGVPVRKELRQRGWSKSTFYRKLDGGAARIAAILGERGVVVR